MWHWSEEIISQRDHCIVKCLPDTTVNNNAAFVFPSSKGTNSGTI